MIMNINEYILNRCRMQYGLLCNMDYSIETKEIPIIVYC